MAELSSVQTKRRIRGSQTKASWHVKCVDASVTMVAEQTKQLFLLQCSKMKKQVLMFLSSAVRWILFREENMWREAFYGVSHDSSHRVFVCVFCVFPHTHSLHGSINLPPSPVLPATHLSTGDTCMCVRLPSCLIVSPCVVTCCAAAVLHLFHVS